MFLYLKKINKIIIIFFVFSSFFLNKNNYYDNKIALTIYENNIDFSNYSTDIKEIAIYLPNFYSFNDTYFYSYKNKLENVVPKYKGHHQPRVLDKNYIENYDLKMVLKKQIELAKSHGIYGFAIYYYWFSGKTIFDKPLNIIYKNENKFHYMLIWKNEKVVGENNELILEEKYEENDSEKFIKDIKKYLIDKLYIRKDEKPIIGIYNIKTIPNLKENILQIRQKAREFEIGEIFIISCLNGQNIDEIYNKNIFDGAYKSPPKGLIETEIKNTKDNYIL
jgi:hypothetical protein